MTMRDKENVIVGIRNRIPYNIVFTDSFSIEKLFFFRGKNASQIQFCDTLNIVKK